MYGLLSNKNRRIPIKIKFRGPPPLPPQKADFDRKMGKFGEIDTADTRAGKVFSIKFWSSGVRALPVAAGTNKGGHYF